ncbi:MAG: MgtC/SapB family protein [Thermoguttaceae bacterium]
MDTLIAKQLLLSLVLGLLVGLQRERSNVRRGGVRTFPLVSIFGTLCGYLATAHGSWILFGGLIVVALGGILPDVMAAVRSILKQHGTDDDGTTRHEIEFGQTTFMATLVMFTVGVLLSMESMFVVAIVVGGGTALLLQFKPEIHRAVTVLSDGDMKAIMQFVLITCIILPVVPNRTLGPYDVINPFETWLMVVFIVGMGLLGYIVSLFWGEGAGSVLTGLLGGAVSSTATTVSVCQSGRDSVMNYHAGTVTIGVASTVVFVRVFVEMFVISREFTYTCVIPLGIMMGLMLLAVSVEWFLGASRGVCEVSRPKNPAYLKTALTFGVLYVVLLLMLAAVRANVEGHGVLTLLAAVSGMTDMDAITLSTARMAVIETTPAQVTTSQTTMMQDGWRLIVAAAMGSLVFKWLIVFMMADRRLAIRVAALFAAPFIGGLAMLIVM